MFNDRQAAVRGLLAAGKKDRAVGGPKRSLPFAVALVIGASPGFDLLHKSAALFAEEWPLLCPAKADQPDHARKRR